METVVWIGMAVAAFVAVWLSEPYHQRIIDSRPRVADKTIED